MAEDDDFGNGAASRRIPIAVPDDPALR